MEEARALEGALAAMRDYRSTETLFAFVHSNHGDFFAHLHAGVHDAQRKQRTDGFGDDLDRKLCNFLTSMRMFLDHAARKLKNDVGPRAAEGFEAARHSEYDGTFGYRFLYHLRNFVQHKGMPTTSCRISSSLGRKAPDDAIVYEADDQQTSVVHVEFDRSVLLADTDLNAKFRKELAEGDGSIDVIWAMRDVLPSLQRLNDMLVVNVAGKLAYHAKRVVDVAMHARRAGAEGELVLAWQPARTGKEQLSRIEQHRWTPLPVETANEVLDMAGEP
jgi:hypothetical protein